MTNRSRDRGVVQPPAGGGKSGSASMAHVKGAWQELFCYITGQPNRAWHLLETGVVDID